MIVPALIGAAGAAYAADQNSKSAASNREAIARQQQIINSVPLPILKEYYPELYAQVAELNPEIEAAQTLGPSAVEDISVDPRLKQAQMNALNKLIEIGDAGGLTAQDKARLAQIEDQAKADLQGQTGAIQQNLATRGLSGGMSEMVARNLAAQGAANRQAQSGMQVAADAEQRALNAIMQSGQLGGQIGAQDYQQQANLAQARDVINKFNLTNLQDVNQRNIAARNAAQASNIGAKQQVANQNVGLKNQAQQYNTQVLPQQQFANQMSRATQNAGFLADKMKADQAAAAQQNALIGGLVQAGAKYYGGSQS